MRTGTAPPALAINLNRLRLWRQYPRRATPRSVIDVRQGNVRQGNVRQSRGTEAIGAHRNRSVWVSPRSGSERIPGRVRGELEVAEVGAKPQTHARADWHQHDIVGGQCRHAEATDEICRTVDAAETVENRRG